MMSFIEQISRSAGKMSLELQENLSQQDISYKATKDIVTTADLAIEGYLRERITAEFPDHGIIGEEQGEKAGDAEYTWIIDPIDGTTSFSRNQPGYSISIALRQRDEIIAGAVYAPRLGELFSAEKGKGAFCNGTALSVSSTTDLEQSLLATGFACQRNPDRPGNIPIFAKVMPAIQGIRRWGSAALDLAYTAAGRLEGFWELNLALYDVAAGLLLVNEAGGLVSDMEGGRNYPARGIWASNGRIHQDLLAMFR